jgi:site-specific DNA-adenine methylase
MNLIQEKLDVKNKTKANLFNWRGQFTPQFVDYMINNFTHSGECLIDPFSGSGTVLLQSSLRNLSCYGYEINPAAYAMSQFVTLANTPLDKRQELITAVASKLKTALLPFEGLPVYIKTPNYRDSYQNLIHVAKQLFSNLSDQKQQILALNLLFLSEHDKKLELKASLTKSFYYLEKSLLSLPYTENLIKANLNDARKVGQELPETADLIFTSPPYINVFNYHQNYRAIIESLNIDILRVAQSEFGANRKHRGNRFKTVVQYCLDMSKAIESFWHALKPAGKMILVMGQESKVRNIAFYNGQMIAQLIQTMGGFTDLHTLERTFTNKFGNAIKEDILIFQKDNQKPHTETAQSVALAHLNQGLSKAIGDVKADILDAIKKIEQVTPSPIFNPKSLFK